MEMAALVSQGKEVSVPEVAATPLLPTLVVVVGIKALKKLENVYSKKCQMSLRKWNKAAMLNFYIKRVNSCSH